MPGTLFMLLAAMGLNDSWFMLTPMPVPVGLGCCGAATGAAAGASTGAPRWSDAR